MANSSLKLVDNKREPKEGLDCLGPEAPEFFRNLAIFSVSLSSVPPHASIGSRGCCVR